MEKPSTAVEPTIAKPQQMKTRHHNATAGPPFQDIQQIVAEAGFYTSTTVQLGVNCQSHLGRVDIRRQRELGVSGIIVASAAL